MKKLFSRFVATLFACLVLCVSSPALAEDFLNPEEAFKLNASISQQDGQVQLNLLFDVAPGYYMYRERFELKPLSPGYTPLTTSTLSTQNILFAKGDVKYDQTFDKEMEVYHLQASLTIPLPNNHQAVTLEITTQGCAVAGLCYPPIYYYIPLSPTNEGMEIALPKLSDGSSDVVAQEASLIVEPSDQINQDSVTTQVSNAINESSFDLLNATDTDIADWLHQASLWHMVIIAFLLGLILSFTPCVLPMLPILLSLIVGNKQTSHFHSVKLTLLYVLGTSIIYTLLGIVAASIGAALANWIQSPWILGLFALFLILFGIAMFGAYTLQMPSSIQTKLNALVNKLPAGQGGATLLMGMISALICGPCVAAPLAGVLLFISQTGDILTGGLILFVLAWGQGASLIILGASSGTLLPRTGVWMETIKKICGLLLFAVALWMTAPLLPDVLAMILWALLALAFAYVVGTFRGYHPFPHLSVFILKLIGWIAVAWAILLFIGVGMGSRSVLHPLQVQHQRTQFERVHSLSELKTILANTDKPVILDFYADWCISCVEMEKFTFSEEKVHALMQNFHLLQADVTGNTDQDRELLKAFRLFGPPGIIFFDKQGQEQPSIRVIGFQNADRFVQTLTKALQQ